jgi:hypothetical protein
MIFAIAALPNRLAAVAFKVDRSGVEKNESQVAEQVANENRGNSSDDVRKERSSREMFRSSG